MNAKLLTQISNNLTPIDTEELYANMLDDCYGECEIAGMKFTTSRALKELDPTAFRCGESDYIDSLSLVEISGDYYEPDAVEAERDGLVADLETEISEIEDEIEEINGEMADEFTEKDDGENQISELKVKMSGLQGELEEIKEFVF